MTDTLQELVHTAFQNGRNMLSEADSAKVLADAGIPMVSTIQCNTPYEAGAATEGILFPVALKGCGSTLAHKSELGVVQLGLTSREAVVDAAKEIQKEGGDAVEGFLLQPMIQGKREWVAGMFRDPQFGAVIMFGLGGIYTEALDDVVFRIAPVEAQDIDDMIDEIAAKAMLGTFRGEEPINRALLKRIFTGLADLAHACPEIKEIDINPLVIQPDGDPVAVDALIILEKPNPEATPTPALDIQAIDATFHPSSIAFVGASATLGKWGNILSSNVLSQEYAGDVYLINPKGGTIFGKPVYPSIAKVPDSIDLAVVTIPANRVLDIIPELEQKATKGMLLITSGFKEVGEEGARLEKAVVDAARKAGILIIGPNTMGICNPHIGLYCTASHACPLPGSTALVCQSGNMGTQLLTFAEQQGIGIRAYAGSGNEGMTTIEDFMEAFEIDDLTRCVVLYLESVKDGKRFFESAKRLSVKKPVIVLKGGRTTLGEQAAASHTGAMASNARVFNAACRQAGIIQVSQPMELLELSSVFSSLPLPKGNRVGILTLGGGWGVITTDLCAEYGLEVPSLTPDIIEKMNAILPEFWSHANPVDIVGETDASIPRACLEELLKWDGCDAVIHLGIHGQRILVDNMINSISKLDPSMSAKGAAAFREALLKQEEEYVAFVAELMQKYQKPVIGVSLLADAESQSLYRFDGCDYKSLFFLSPEQAVKAVASMAQYETWRQCR